MYPLLLPISFILNLLASTRNTLLPQLSLTRPACKALPGDDTWPTPSVWTTFNASVDGRLVRTIPIGLPCHAGPGFNQTKCDFIKANWHETDLHLHSSSSVMTPLFANKSCDPFSPPDAQCVIGSYVQNAVNVSTVAHVAKTLAFAKSHNLRFVIRNTGHDYMGKSTGTGAISVWTHHRQETNWIDEFRSSFYNGPAIKAYAGALVEQVYELADKHDHVVVGGDCKSVGFTGGYIQGGGHSLLTSMFGMASDSALEYEVITTNGVLVTASPTENSDLYWALSGGGGGTYGIVWSVTVKAYPNLPVTVANFDFTAQDISKDAFWKGVEAFQAVTPKLTDLGSYAISIYGSSFFSGGPIFAPNLTKEQVMDNFLDPVFSELTSLGIKYSLEINSYPTFQAAFDSIPGFVKFQVGILNFGGRILPRSLWEDEKSFEQMMQVIRDTIDNSGKNGMVYDVTFRPPSGIPGVISNSVLPAWRTAQKFFISLLPWEDTASLPEMRETQNKITYILDEPLRRLAPDSGTYLNEANVNEPNWQQAFYGANYYRLLEIKDKWDPDQVLYGSTAVGGDRWKEDDFGRLCKL